MDFIPEQPKTAAQVPFFEEATVAAGWRGHTTGKSVEQLQSEISAAIGRLGGLVSGYVRGKWIMENGVERHGFRIDYIMSSPGGARVQGVLDIAGLPVKGSHRKWKTVEHLREQSCRMALFMAREALEGAWFMQQLSPGYSALIPWLIEPHTRKTITALWTEKFSLPQLAPPEDAEFTEYEGEDDE